MSGQLPTGEPASPADRELLRSTFESVAARYDQARPGCPDELIDAMADLAGDRPGDHLLEVGGGTGKATVPLARRGLRITVLELGAALAAQARATSPASPASRSSTPTSRRGLPRRAPASMSGHIAMAPWQRDRLYGSIRRRLADRPDGRLRRHWGAVLHVARRRA